MRMWQLRRNGVPSDPIPEDEVEAMLEAGTIEGSLPVRPVGKDAWKPAFRHAPFAAAMSQSILLPAFVALFGVVAAIFLVGAFPRRHAAGQSNSTAGLR